VKSVGHKLPIENATVRFDSFWERYWWLFVKGWHATEYAILFLLLQMALSDRRTLPRFGISLLVCLAYAASDEYHQTFVPGRGGNVFDVTIDMGGALVAAVICYLLLRRKGRMNPPCQEPASHSSSPRS
jgi:VanZ family protein